MKHWDGRDRDDVAELRLSQRDRQRLAQVLRSPARARPARPHIGSVIGLALAIGVLVSLAFLLAPSDPVSSKVLN